MDASIATGPLASGTPVVQRSSPAERLGRRSPQGTWTAPSGSSTRAGSPSPLAVVAPRLLGTNPHRWDFYNHFVWQAQAWLDGSTAIRCPVEDGIRANDYFQDVLPARR